MKLLQSLEIGRYLAKNRIFMSPLTRNRASEENIPTDIMIEYYKQRSSAGLIISEGTAISKDSIGYVRKPGIFNQQQIDNWRKITDAVHQQGGIIFCQIWHVGRNSHSDFLGHLPLAPSELKLNGRIKTPFDKKEYEIPKSMNLDEINQTIEDFAQAAKNAIKAGFDGVELHGANGYLIEQFISDSANIRQDAYGGSIENHCRFALEAIDAVTNAIGGDRTAIRLSPSGIYGEIYNHKPIEKYSYLIEQLNKYNLAYLHLMEPYAPLNENYAHYLQEWEVAPYYRKIYNGKIVSNVNYTREKAEEVLRNGYADAIAFGKDFLANPDLPYRLENNLPLNQFDRNTFYSHEAEGYIDYPYYNE